MQTRQPDAVGAQGVPSWADCLRAAGIETASALIAPAALARVMALGAALPALHGGGLECHLLDRERVDVAVRLLPLDGGRDALLGRHPTLHFPPSLARSAPWQRLQTLGERWAAAGTAEHRGLESVWLEFDLPAGSALYIPSLFIGCRSGAAAERSAPRWLAESAAILAGPASAASVRAGLLRWEALPQVGARLVFVGLMLSRQDAGVRLVLKGLAADALHRYVAMLGWPGDLDALARTLSELVPKEAALALHFDLDPELGSRIGVELALSDHPRYSPGWQQLIRGLVGRGACDESAAQALTDWPGLISCANGAPPGRTWRGLRGIVRRINHVKLSFHPQKPLLAKAYLYCGLLY